MAPVKSMPEITEIAVRALVRELGYADASRFLNTLRPRRSDYTRSRRELLVGLSTDDVLAMLNPPRSQRRRRAPKKSA